MITSCSRQLLHCVIRAKLSFESVWAQNKLQSYSRWRLPQGSSCTSHPKHLSPHRKSQVGWGDDVHYRAVDMLIDGHWFITVLDSSPHSSSYTQLYTACSLCINPDRRIESWRNYYPTLRRHQFLSTSNFSEPVHFSYFEIFVTNSISF